jgi:hypothetical protein
MVFKDRCVHETFAKIFKKLILFIDREMMIEVNHVAKNSAKKPQARLRKFILYQYNTGALQDAHYCGGDDQKTLEILNQRMSAFKNRPCS